MKAAVRPIAALALALVMGGHPAPAFACDLPANAAGLLAATGAEINAVRQQNGRKVLRRSAQLDQAAQRHACWMSVQNTFSHQGARGSKPRDRIAATGYRARLTSENIASGQTSGPQVVAEWMASQGHRANILRDKVSDYGIGVALLQGRPVWVMVYAQPR